MTDPIRNTTLKDLDAQLYQMIRKEAERQQRKLIFIASESICPPAVREALASELGNIYAEGYPSPRTFFEPPAKLSSFQFQLAQFRRLSNRRYYKGCEYVDIIEQTLRRRTAEVFANDRVSADQIFVNTQPLSGAAANNAVYNAFVRAGECVMGPSLTHGGHLTHGSEVNRSGLDHKIIPYLVAHSGKLDYDAIEKLAVEHSPKLLISGFSAYPWDIDWKRLREIADHTGAILLADIAHLAGMVAAGHLNSPVGYAHVVSFTTHKTLCGPRGAMLLSTHPEIAAKLDMGVFPGEQGGPHVHQLAAKAVAMQIAKTPEFRELQSRVLENARALAKAFADEGLELAYGGTNTHLCLIDLRRVKTANGLPLTGEIASRILDLCGIVCNKNTIFGDTNAVHPSGLRFGTTWVTQRGLTPEHMKHIGALIAKALKAIQPFSYIGGRIDWGRGKIAPAVVEEIAAAVDALVAQAASTFAGEEQPSGYPHFTAKGDDGPRKTPLTSLHKSQAVKMKEQNGWLLPATFGQPEKERAALADGAALVDSGGMLLLEIGQGRAGQLLECACSSEILTLAEGRATATLLLDSQGALLARAIILRLPADEDGFDRFWAAIHTREPDRILRWLRGLSDGYFLHDDDLWLKCEGPCVIEELTHPSDGRAPVSCLGLRGPKAAQVVERAFGLTTLFPGAAATTNGLWVVCRPAGDQPGFDVFVPVSKAAATWSKLLEAGAQPVGCDALAQLEEAAERESVNLLQGPLSSLIELAKPFFIGQKALLKDVTETEPRAAFSWTPAESPLKHTCLLPEHEKLTKAMHLVPFAGWKMPVLYSGILEEHAAVRNHGGLFDVSHMGVLEVTGAFAERFLDLVTANYVPTLCPGQAHYSYLFAHDGRCIDDIIVYRLEKSRFMVVVNAANADEDEAWLRSVQDGKVLLDPRQPQSAIRGEVTLRNLKDPKHGADCKVDLAFQGRATYDVFAKICDPASLAGIRRLRKFEHTAARMADLEVRVARTGYTGEEIGFEVFVHPDSAVKLWNTILDTGKPFGVAPIGLGARDSLRTEAGFPLHGHELAGPNQVTAIEAGYGSYVKLHKPFFVGRGLYLSAHKLRKRMVVRFEVDEKGGKVLRVGNPVLSAKKGEFAGVVTSCCSTGDRQVGMALIDTKHAKVGTKLSILPITEGEKAPPARSPLELKAGDWVTIPRSATVRARFMKPGEKPLA